MGVKRVQQIQIFEWRRVLVAAVAALCVSACEQGRREEPQPTNSIEPPTLPPMTAPLRQPGFRAVRRSTVQEAITTERRLFARELLAGLTNRSRLCLGAFSRAPSLDRFDFCATFDILAERRALSSMGSPLPPGNRFADTARRLVVAGAIVSGSEAEALTRLSDIRTLISQIEAAEWEVVDVRPTPGNDPIEDILTNGAQPPASNPSRTETEPTRTRPTPILPCSQSVDGAFRQVALATLNVCVQTLFAGRCMEPGQSELGRWDRYQLRHVWREVQIAEDGVNYRFLVTQDFNCRIPELVNGSG